MLLTGLAFPAVSLALGLGDIHVSSALGQPLEAQIDLIDTPAQDSAPLTARIPDDDEFRLHGLERPAFLSRTTLAIGRDDQGHPALIVHSIDGVSEPVVTLLVGVRFRDGELVREYTVLLDPADRAPRPAPRVVGSVTPAVAVQPSPPAPTPEAPITSPAATAPARARSASDGKPPRRGLTRGPHTYTVAARDTLDRIARSAGASAKAEVHRMAVAIYRGNPEAFRGNLNLLRLGATLRLPSAEQLSAINAQDAEREYAAQMQTWRAGAHGTAPAPQQRGAGSDEAQIRALAEHVRALQKALSEQQQELKRPLEIPASPPVLASPAGVDALARDPALTRPIPAPVVATSAKPESREASIAKATFFALLCGTLLLAFGVWFYGRRRSSQIPSGAPQPAEDSSRTITEGTAEHALACSEASWFTDPADTLAAGKSAARQPAIRNPPDATAESLPPEPEEMIETEVLPAAVADFADTTHLVISGDITKPAPFVERRRNPADVLRQAIEREPHRSDLRLKLLELYYAGAAQNQRAFLEVAQQLARKDGLVSPEDWSRITDMGRAIAPDSELFSEAAESKKAVA